MSERTVRQTGDELLRKQSKDVTELNDRLKELISDMKDTMKIHGGCGLAAVQVGVLKKIIICAPEEDKEPIVLINPEIISASEEKEDDWTRTIAAMEQGILRPEKQITHRLPFEELHRGLGIMRAKSEYYNKVMIVR